MNTDIKRWFFSIPIVTRTLFVASFGVTIFAAFEFFSMGRLVLLWPMVVKKFQIWRLVSSFFLHSLGFSFLILMKFLYDHSTALESTVFLNRTSDYAFFIFFCMGVLLLFSWPLKLVVLGRPLVLSILYLWSRKFPTQQMSFYFGIKFQGFYLPWVLTGFEFLMGASLPKGSLAGIMAGHIYFFLTDVWPSKGGRRWLDTPQFMYNLFPRNYNQAAATHQVAAVDRARHHWGQANSLNN